MIFDLDKLNEGEWFPYFDSKINDKGEVVYDDPSPSAGRVRIRDITPLMEKQVANKKRISEFTLNPLTRQMDRVTYFEDQTIDQVRQERDDVWDYAILAWEDFYDVKGSPIECNRENKLLLMRIPAFDRFMARCLQLLGNTAAKAEKEQEKN